MVGDCETSEPVQALVRAAREAMVNAAKHSGADKIDVYAEVDEDRVEVFVRDRGQGFDLDGGGRRPDGRQGQHHRPDGPPRRNRHRPFPARRRHRSTTGDQPMSTPAPETVPTAHAAVGPYRVVVVDDHAMFRTGVKAEIGTRGRRSSARRPTSTRAIAVVLRTAAGRGAARRAPARRRRHRGAAQGARAEPRPEVPGPVGLRRGRGRDRRDPGRRPRLRHQVHQRRRADRRDPAGRRGRRGVLAAAGRLRAGRVLRSDRPRHHRRGPGPAVGPRSARCCG